MAPRKRFNFSNVGGSTGDRTTFLRRKIEEMVRERLAFLELSLSEINPQKINEIINRIASKSGSSDYIPGTINVSAVERPIRLYLTSLINRYTRAFDVAAAKAAMGGRIAAGGKDAGKAQGFNRIAEQYPQVINEAQRRFRAAGGSLRNITGLRPTQDLETGITKFAFTTEDATGKTQRLTLVLDELGRVMTQTEQRTIAAANREQKEILQQAVTHRGQLQGLRQRFPKATEALYKADPRFVTDPQTQIKTTEDPTTGITRIRASFEELDGATRQVNLALDKSGRVLQDTSKRFNTFTGSLRRNIGEFFKWSLAVGLIYGPMRKLQELIQVAVSNQTKLVDVTITLGLAQGAMNKIFEDAARIAALTGEELNGVIEGYNLAVRATGNITDKTERYAVANQLLTDSIILSKLSSLEQTEATDTLAAALIQTGISLDNGQELLDKWVRVSRVANVDISTLATSFGILAAAADKAGLSVDELNGLIAVVAEAGITSPKETGTAVRAIVSGFTTDTAVKELQSFGISVLDSEGKARDFLEVFQAIKDAFDAGFISEDQLNSIAVAIGGGSRRGPQTLTALVKLGRLNEIAAESANAHGEAQEALDLKLDTVETRVTKLGNSFQILAQAMGTDGGILDSFSLLLTIATALTGALSGLTSTLGVAAPVLAGLGLSRIVTTGGQRAVAGRAIADRVAGLFYGRKFAATAKATYPDPSATYSYPTPSGQILRAPGSEVRAAYVSDATSQKGGQLATGRLAKASGSLMFTGFLAAMQAAKGDMEGAMTIAGVGLVAGIATGFGPASFVATTITSIFVNAVQKAIEAARGQTIDVFSDAVDTAMENAEVDTDPFTKLVEGAGGPQIAGRNILLEQAINFFKGEKQSELEILAGLATKPSYQPAILDPLGGATNKPLSEEMVEYLLQLGGFKSQPLPETRGGEITPYGARYTGDDLEKIMDEANAYLTGLLHNLPTAEISAAEFRKRKESVQRLPATLPQYTAPLTFGGVSDDTAIQQILDIILKGSEEDVSTLSGAKGDIEHISGLIDTAQDAGIAKIQVDEVDGVPIFQALDEAIKSRDMMVADFVKMAEILSTQANLAKTKIPTTLNLDVGSAEDLDTVKNLAIEMMENWASKLEPDEARKYKEIQLGQDFFVEYLGDQFERMKEIDPAMLQKAFQKAIEDNIIKPLEDITLSSINELEIDQSQLPNILARYEELLASAINQSAAQGFTFEENKEPQLIQFTDGHLQVVEANWSLLMMVINEILETEKQQLEGIYNLPSDGTFFVPWQAAAIRPGADGDGGTLETDIANQRLIEFGDQLRAVALGIGDAFADIFPPEGGSSPFTEAMMDTPQSRFEEAIKVLMSGLGPPKPGLGSGSRMQTRDDFVFDRPSGGGGISQEFRAQLDRQLRVLSNQLGTYDPYGSRGAGGGGGGLQQEVTSLVNALGSAKSAIVNLNMSLNAKFMVNLDGRVIATAIKRYLHKDLIRGGIGSSVVNRSVIIQV